MSGTSSRRLAGVATMTIDGDPWDVVGDLAWLTSPVKRETLMGQTAVEGYSEMPQACFISATLRDRPDETVLSLNGLTNSAITVVQANGKSIYGASMWCTEIGEVNTREGTFTIKFEGPLVSEGTL